MKKERWKESELVSLPLEEQDFFERKSGAILKDTDCREKIAKAVSAFANSGGGHLIIGVENDGSIDGVPKLRKGRTSTKDWIEQNIPNLVSYPLQDFRVHEVEPDTPSAIPQGNVVIVVDIGDSILAPHQSSLTKIYYHRAGGRSEPAPHHFLEVLRGRDKYPSQKIAHAWLNFVIAPLLKELRIEEENLVNPQQPWSGYRTSLTRTSYFKPFGAKLSANDIQFLKSYEGIREEIGNHDAAVTCIQNEAEHLVRTIETSHFMSDAYSRFQTSEYLQQVREIYRGRVAETDEKLRQNLFGDRPPEQTRKILAEFVAYDYPQTDEPNYVWPIWQTYKPDLMEFLKQPPLREQNDRLTGARNELLDRVRSLITALEAIQHELAFQHGEPYEDSTLQRPWPQQATLY
jgi:hypothetical protein